MFKDFNKYLSTSLKVYLFVLVIIFILKLMGLDCFGIDINNITYLRFNNFVVKYGLENVYYTLTLLFYTYIFVSLTNNRNDKKAKIGSIAITMVSIGLKYVDTLIANTLIIAIVDFFYLFIACYFLNDKYSLKEYTKRFIKVYVLNTIFQLISLHLRNINYHNINLSFIIRAILDLDYILMMVIYYKIYFSKGGAKQCGVEVISSLLMKLNLKNLLKRLQTNLHSFKQLDKKTRLTYIIYFIFSLIWNIFSVIVVLFVAKLNNTLIECIFIFTSFLLSKHAFGEPFHLSSMAQCFVVSNLTYYMLNRITTPLGISILVPIMLGVGLSYITSKLVKKLYKPLYRGMPEDLFNETILKIVDKDSDKYKICYDFFINKKSAISLSMKYNYSEAGIRMITKRVNNKIKELK